MSKLKEKLMLSEKGYSDLKKAITACTITNIALLLPSMVACLLFWELLKPFTGEAISWAALWKLLGLGLVAAILVFLAAKNDYRKTYIASYKEASTTRLRIAEHLRKLPMSFFNTKDLSDITTNMMADCSSMESMLSSTIPPLIANIISVTLTCVCLAFFDWRMALAIFCTMPVTFLIIWCGRKLQLRLFDKQVDVKLEASSQIQEYLEGIKIIKSCGLGGSRFDALDKALQAMKKIAIKVELASGILVQGASLILQAGLGITIFIGTVLITGGKIELLPLLVLLMFFGACAGSTGGGIKISRIIIMCKTAKQDLMRVLHPHAVTTVRFEGKPLDDKTVFGVRTYMNLYLIIFVLSTMVVAINQFDLVTTFTAVASCLNNIGPGLNQVGPMMNFGAYSNFAKLVLIFDMLAGRLEIFPMLVLFLPDAWRRF